MSQPLSIARDFLLQPAGLTENQLQSVLSKMLDRNVDYAELYFQLLSQEVWELEDSIVKEGSFDMNRGVGVRAISGEKTGYAFSDEIMLPSLEQAANAAKTIAKQSGHHAVKAWHATQARPLYPELNPLITLDENAKIHLLKSIDAHARALDPRVTQVKASLSGVYEIVLIAASDGSFVADIRPLVRLNVSVIVESGGKRELGYTGGGGRFGYQYFLENNRGLEFASDAVRQALQNLEAKNAPAGVLPVVLGPGWPGVLLHEAIGHGLEGDFNRKGSSAFAGRLGEKVASSLCTVVDDGTLPNRRGSVAVDDEGTPGQYTVLIENGILKNYMMDKLNARLMGVQSTGNGRRESYSNIPLPRMTNTYLLPGKQDPQEIIASVDKGIYAVNFGGGQVDITSGKFVFSMSEAYMIEKGKITYPIKGATLIGNGPDVLTKVSMVGNDLKLDEGVGTCGKEGQSVPVGVGQPTLRIDGLTVGGTQ